MPHVMSKRLVRLAASAAAVGVARRAGRGLRRAVDAADVVYAAPDARPRRSTSFPQQNVLPVWPDNPNDASANVGDIPYDEIAPKLNALQAASNRVSARVAGKSAGGYDLYAVVLTAPETAAQYTQQETWKQWLEDNPNVARVDPALLAGYKTPLFANGNIHGNEKEGADAIIKLIEEWATSTDPAVETLLQRNRIIFNVTSNPDGRVANTRANAAGYDLNRDLTIRSQPESRLIADLIVQVEADHHARPARLRQPDADAPEHAAAQRQQRVRPLHQARPAERAQHGAGDRAARLPRGHARADPVPRRRAGRVGRLPADLRAVVRDAAELDPVHDRGAVLARQRRRPRAPRGHRHRRPRRRDQDLAEVHPGQPQPGHLRPGRGLPPRLGRRAAARHPGRLRRGLGPGGQVHDHVPALVRDPGRHAPALRSRRSSAWSTC